MSMVMPKSDHRIEREMAKKGYILPELPGRAGKYVAVRLWGDTLFLSGQGPVGNDKAICGVVGQDVTLEEAIVAARLCGLNLLAAAKAALGTLDRVAAVLKVFGMVNAAPGFTLQPKVIDGCSSLFCEVFGNEIGNHARSAVGMGSLPANISVEIEAVFAVKT